VKELRLAGIDNMDDANAFAPSYLVDYDRRFGKAPSSDVDMHRPLRDTDDLDYTFCWREQRKLSKNLVVHYKRVMYLVEPTHENKGFAQNKIDILEWVDGSVELWCDGVKLDHSIYDKTPSINEAAIVENKRLGAVLSFCQELQKKKEEELVNSGKLTKREKSLRMAKH